MTVYKLSSNENPYPPLPGVVAAATAAAERMNRYPDMGNAELYGALSTRLAVPVEHLALATGSVALIYQLVQAFCEPGRRGRLRLALLRGLPDRGDRRGRDVGQGAGPGRRPSRPRRDGRRDHRPHQGRPGLHPQQPHRPRGHAGRARRVPGPGADARAGRGRRGVRRVRADGRPDRRHRHLPRPRQRAAHADLLQGLRPGRLPGRLRRRTRADRRGTAFGLAAVRRLQRRPGRGRRVPRRRGRAAAAGGVAGRGADPRRTGPARRRLGRSRTPGQLRLVRARRAHRRVRRRRRRPRHRGPPVRGRGRAGLHRRARGQRPDRGARPVASRADISATCTMGAWLTSNRATSSAT